MKKTLILLFTLMLVACTSIKVGNKHTNVIIKKEKPFCDIKKVDPNCKIEDRNK
jgi:uncharacterized protein YcfL